MAIATHSTPDRATATGAAPNLVRWGAVFGAGIIAIASFALIGSLWVALSFSYPDGFISTNLDWFITGTAIGALGLGGFLAGFLSGSRGAKSGLLNGVTTWGLLFLASVFTIVPGLTTLTSQLSGGLAADRGVTGGLSGTAGNVLDASNAAWVTFWSLLIGVGAAALGGLIGGAAKRTIPVSDTAVRERGGHDEERTTQGAHAYRDDTLRADDPVVTRR